MFLKNLAILLIFIFLIACEKDPSASKTEHKVSVKGAFILNEGNFMHRNASLSFYDFEQQNIQNNIYETVNAVALGDVLQSMTIIDTLGFLAVNNSHKIEVISLNTWKKVATINMDGKGPRAIADGGNGNVYVTNMNSGNVSVIRISDFTEQALITVGAQPDEIVAQNQKAYVANSGWGYDHTVSVIDLNQNKVIKTINVADNPGYLISDKNEDIHVLCTGRWPAWGDTTDPGTNGGLYIIDAGTQTVKDSLIITGHPSELSYDGDDTGYFINNGKIVSYSVTSCTILSDSTFDGTYYSMEADPVSGKIFALDSRDYQQSGYLNIFLTDGTLDNVYGVGIIPGAITFVYQEE